MIPLGVGYCPTQLGPRTVRKGKSLCSTRTGIGPVVSLVYTTHNNSISIVGYIHRRDSIGNCDFDRVTLL